MARIFLVGFFFWLPISHAETQTLKSSHFSAKTFVSSRLNVRPLSLRIAGDFPGDSLPAIMEEAGAVLLRPLEAMKQHIVYSFMANGTITPGKAPYADIQMLIEPLTLQGKELIGRYVEECERLGLRGRSLYFQAVDKIWIRYDLRFEDYDSGKKVAVLKDTISRSFSFNSLADWIEHFYSHREKFLSPESSLFLSHMEELAKFPDRYQKLAKEVLPHSNRIIAEDQSLLLLTNGQIEEPFENVLPDGYLVRRCYEPQFGSGACL